MKRTHLPLNALRVYDAAARHLSFTRAADELAVTPAAVGQQIRALEDHLGTVLFRRTSKGLELTEEGMAGLDSLREGFLKFEESVQSMQAGQASDRYTIAAPREFYAQWLAPRLAAFREDNPGIRFRFVADENADFTETNLDFAVRLVDGPGELEGVELAPARRVVVAASGASAEVLDNWIDWPGAPLPEGVARARSTKKRWSAPKNSSSPRKKVGAPNAPRATASSVLLRSSFLISSRPRSSASFVESRPAPMSTSARTSSSPRSRPSTQKAG